jgi:hypothetical protein
MKNLPRNFISSRFRRLWRMPCGVAARRLTWVPTSEILLKKAFRPDHAQLEFGEVGGRYPEWSFGSEPVVASEEKIVVATLPDFEGDAMLEVWRIGDESPPDVAGELIYDGVIRLSGEDAEAGTYLGADLERIRLGSGVHRIRLFVDKPGYASHLVFVVTHAPGV